jgi:hypothetical protein
MNYIKIYDNLISKAKDRKLIGYCEKHHIIPKCMNGSNDPNNIVKLTPEEHYLAHQLLTKIYPFNLGLAFAASLLATHDTDRRQTNKQYGWIKRKISTLKKQNYKDNPSEQVKNGLFRGHVHSKKSKKKISENCKKALRLFHEKKIFCFHLNGTLAHTFMCLSEAADFVNTSPSNIKYTAEGKFSNCKGYKWSYNSIVPIASNNIKLSNRVIMTPNGTFPSVTAVVEYFNFSSTVQVRRRCLSDAMQYKEWYYMDSLDNIDKLSI